MQHLAATVFQHHEHQQHFHRDRRHGEEMHGHHLAEVVVEKCLPRLMGRPTESSQNSRDGTVGHRDAEHLQFAVNAWRSPQRIGRHHSFDPWPHLGGRRGPPSVATMGFGQPPPESAKPFPLPSHDRVGLDVYPWTTPAGPQAAECDPEHPIEGGQNRSRTFSLEGRQLQSESSILGSQRLGDRSSRVGRIGTATGTLKLWFGH